MANEFTFLASLSYLDSELTSLALAIPQNLQKTITTKRYFQGKMSVTTTEVAINLGTLTTLGYAIFLNRDTTNFIELRVATGGTRFARLDATNGFWLGKIGSGITAPFAIADTAACQMDYLLFAP